MIIVFPLEEANDNYDEAKNLVLQIFNNAFDNFEKKKWEKLRFRFCSFIVSKEI